MAFLPRVASVMGDLARLPSQNEDGVGWGAVAFSEDIGVGRWLFHLSEFLLASAGSRNPGLVTGIRWLGFPQQSAPDRGLNSRYVLSRRSGEIRDRGGSRVGLFQGLGGVCSEPLPCVSLCQNFPTPHLQTQREGRARNRDVGSHPTLGLPAPWSWTSASGTVRNELLLFMSRLVYGFLVDVATWACRRVGVSGESVLRGWDGHGLSLGPRGEGPLSLRARGSRLTGAACPSPPPDSGPGPVAL